MSQAKIAAIDARIEKLQAERANLVIALANQVDPATLAGKEVAYNFGRGEAKAVRTGTVLGVTFPEAGKKGAPIVRVLTGSGAESRIDGIFVSQIVSVKADDSAETVSA